MEKWFFGLFVINFCLFHSGCMNLSRSRGSGYSLNDQISSVTKTTENKTQTVLDPELKKIAYELGLDPRLQLSEGELNLVKDRLQVRALERSLNSRKEKEQYSKVLPWFLNDQEKLEFLNIPSLEGRQTWIQQHQIWSRSQGPNEELKTLVDNQDITLGMQQDLVRKSWGEPQAVEVSGNPIYKNERWKYIRYITSPEGFKKETRMVYFEGGRVVGWESE